MDEKERIYNDIRKRIRRKYENRKEFISHVAGYLFAMFFMWFIISSPYDFLNTHDLGTNIARIISGMWTIGILIHGVQFMMDEMRENAINRELERHEMFRGKLKNEERAYRLQDDGEIIADDYDDYDEAPRRDRI